MAKDYTRCVWCGRTIEKKGVNKFLSRNTMGIAGKQKNSYCSKKCQLEAQAAENGSTALQNSQNQGFPTGANASGGGDNVTVVNKGDGFLTAATKGMFSGLNDMKTELKEEEKALENKIESVASITFDDNIGQITNDLNKLSSFASSKPDKELKKAIIEKMEFGIFKLKQLNAIAESEFFENKLISLKKKKLF